MQQISKTLSHITKQGATMCKAKFHQFVQAGSDCLHHIGHLSVVRNQTALVYFTNLRVIAVSLHLEVDQATPSTSGRPVGHCNYLQKNRQPAILPNRKSATFTFTLVGLSHKGVTTNMTRPIFYICLANIFSLILATL